MDTYPAGYPYFVRGRGSVREYICDLFTTEIAMYDGAMGTMIQKHLSRRQTTAATRFKDVEQLIKGNNDMLSITKPEVIKSIYTGVPRSGRLEHDRHQHLFVDDHRAGRLRS